MRSQSSDTCQADMLRYLPFIVPELCPLIMHKMKFSLVLGYYLKFLISEFTEIFSSHGSHLGCRARSQDIILEGTIQVWSNLRRSKCEKLMYYRCRRLTYGKSSFEPLALVSYNSLFILLQYLPKIYVGI
jgi:hypothetical protein